jgi:hypothetical protein
LQRSNDAFRNRQQFDETRAREEEQIRRDRSRDGTSIDTGPLNDAVASIEETNAVLADWAKRIVDGQKNLQSQIRDNTV